MACIWRDVQLVRVLLCWSCFTYLPLCAPLRGVRPSVACGLLLQLLLLRKHAFCSVVGTCWCMMMCVPPLVVHAVRMTYLPGDMHTHVCACVQDAWGTCACARVHGIGKAWHVHVAYQYTFYVYACACVCVCGCVCVTVWGL